MATVDPDLQKWVDEALELGLGCFEDGDRTPFSILIAGDKRHLTVLKSTDGTISEALLEAGRGLIRQFAESGQYYVLVWDGYLTTAGDDSGAGDEEIRWAIEHASPAVHEVVRRLPARGPGHGRLDALLYRLDAGLRRCWPGWDHGGQGSNVNQGGARSVRVKVRSV